YLDDTFRVEIGVELAGPFKDEGEVVRSATPAGKAIMVTHLGPYPGLRDAYAALKDWARANKHKLVGPSWEVYGHWEPGWNSDPSKIRTDVYFVVKPA